MNVQENKLNTIANSKILHPLCCKMNAFKIRFFSLQTASRNKSRPSTFIQQATSRAQDTPLYVATAVQWEGFVCRRVEHHLERRASWKTENDGANSTAMAKWTYSNTFGGDTFVNPSSSAEKAQRSHLQLEDDWQQTLWCPGGRLHFNPLCVIEATWVKTWMTDFSF